MTNSATHLNFTSMIIFEKTLEISLFTFDRIKYELIF